MNNQVPTPSDTDLPQQQGTQLAVPARSLISSIAGAINASWNPRPLPVPKVDPRLPHLPALQRITEASQYTILKLGYSLSAGGSVRAWLKLNVLLAIVLAIPAVIVLPTDFTRGQEDHSKGIVWILLEPVLLQAPEDILDVDDRVVASVNAMGTGIMSRSTLSHTIITANTASRIALVKPARELIFPVPNENRSSRA